MKWLHNRGISTVSNHVKYQGSESWIINGNKAKGGQGIRKPWDLSAAKHLASTSVTSGSLGVTVQRFRNLVKASSSACSCMDAVIVNDPSTTGLVLFGMQVCSWVGDCKPISEI